MTFYSYTRDIPDGPNNPSADQPIMKQNANSIDSILQVDLYGFENNNGGTHKKVTLPLNVAPAAPAGLASVIYSQPGTADVSRSQALFQNSTNTLLLSAVRAFGTLQTVATNGAVVPLNKFNVSSVTSSSNGTIYTIALTANAVNGTSPSVFLNTSSDALATWSFSANTLVITVNNSSLPKLSFLLLQA